MTTAPVRRFPLGTAAALGAFVVACAIYANLAFTVTNPADYVYWPPFMANVNANRSRNLGTEYFSIARALAAGEGFAHPFHRRTGPTAWMPPVLPLILASLLWLCDGDRDAVMAVMLVVQTCVLIGTGVLILALARATTSRIGAAFTAALFAGCLLVHFFLCFQTTHDVWLVMLALDLLLAGMCWFEPLRTRSGAFGWGLFGGACALATPAAGLAWGVGTLLASTHRRSWSAFGFAAFGALLVVAPWTIRNYLVFGRWIPVKSNIAYELYQSHCLQADGLLQRGTFTQHPNASGSYEAREYGVLGEMAYLDRKSAAFWQAVRDDPMEFVVRVTERLWGMFVWYEPLDRHAEARRPFPLAVSRLTFPLPTLAIAILLLTSVRCPLHRWQIAAMTAYVAYLLPYTVISYYERYAVPTLGIKVLLVVWAADRVWRLFPGEARMNTMN